MEFRADLVAKIALAAFLGILLGLIVRTSARWLLRLLGLIVLIAAIYVGAQALGLLGR